MPAILLSGPAAEPLTLADAKRYLRVEHDDDDTTIAALVAAARHHAEALTRRALITQTWRLVRDAWPDDGRIALRAGPLQSVVAARVYDMQNQATAVDPGIFVRDASNDAIAAPPWSLPPPGRDVAGIEIDVRLGYGDTADAVPELVRHAIRLLVAHWYENRGLVAIGQSVAMMPAAVNAMLASFRVVTLC